VELTENVPILPLVVGLIDEDEVKVPKATEAVEEKLEAAEPVIWMELEAFEEDEARPDIEI